MYGDVAVGLVGPWLSLRTNLQSFVSFCLVLHPVIGLEPRTGVLYPTEFGQNVQNWMARRRMSTSKIKWLAYTYAEK